MNNNDIEILDNNVDNNNISESNNMNNKPKKSKKGIIVIILLLLIIAGLCTFIYLKKDVLFNNGNNNNNTNENNNANTNENNNNQQQNENKKQELSSADKKKILDIIGLTENGYKRITSGMGYDTNYTDGNYIDLGSFDIADFFITSDSGKHTVNDIVGNNLADFLILYYPSEEKRKAEENINDTNNPCYNFDSQVDSGCVTIGENQLNDYLRKYNIDFSKKSKLQKYKEMYIISYTGGISAPFKISDNISFSYDSDDVLVTYNVHLMNVDNGLTASLTQFFDSNHVQTSANKKIVFRFKTYDDGSFYLYYFTVTNNV